MSHVPSKSELLDLIDREETFWNQFVAEIGQERMLEPGATDQWSFKDVVAHLNGWRARTLIRLDAARHDRRPAPPPWSAHVGEDDTQDINDWIYKTSRNQPLQEVLDTYTQSFQHMRDAVAALSDQDLTERGRYNWLEGEPLAAVITASFEHLHEEHEPLLRAWLAQSQA
jgi:hypothetical protein